MCTLTFLPLGTEDYLFTSNRDEATDREPALLPQQYEIAGQKVTFPKDGRAQGTWVAASKDVSLCLLNGAFYPHYHKAPYRISRGLILLEYFKYRNAETFGNEFDFTGIEPFTLIIIEEKPDLQLHELRWDEKQVYIKALDYTQPLIWSSSTLYTSENIALRRSWFEEWLEKARDYTTESIIEFHHLGGKGDMNNGLIMQRDNGVQTISITCISNRVGLKEMLYEDTLRKEFSKTIIS